MNTYTYLLRSTSDVGFSGIAFETSAYSEFGSLRVDAELDGRRGRWLVDEVVVECFDKGG